MKTPLVYTRRHFLKTSILGSAMSWTIPVFLENTLNVLSAQANQSVIGTTTGKDGTILVLLQLAGGNDGLNTIIPVTNDLYYNARPTISIRPNQTLRITDDIGINARMSGFKNLFDAGNLSIIQGVGYPNPNRSHFASTDIWMQGARLSSSQSSGWVGRYFDSCCSGSDPSEPLGVSTTKSLPLAMVGEKSHNTLSFTNPKQIKFDPNKSTIDESLAFFKELNKPTSAHGAPVAQFLERTALDSVVVLDKFKRVMNRPSKSNYPNSEIGQELQYIAKMISGEFSTRVYYASQRGYDNHGSAEQHTKNLSELDSAVSAFVADLKAHGKFNQVVIMTFSEFGRRVKQNGAGGTDHGTAAPMFVIGGKVTPGVLGDHPSLSDLQGGDLKHNVDFRSVYSTVLAKWLNANPEEILQGKYEQMAFL